MIRQVEINPQFDQTYLAEEAKANVNVLPTLSFVNHKSLLANLFAGAVSQLWFSSAMRDY